MARMNERTFTGKTATATGATTAVAIHTPATDWRARLRDIVITTESTSALDIQVQIAGTTVLRASVKDTAPLVINNLNIGPLASAGQAITILLPLTGGGAQQVYHYVTLLEDRA
jgi:hypothetical protein